MPTGSKVVKPLPYQHQRRDPWRPASRPPQRGKSASIARLIENIQHQDRAIAEFMREAQRPQK